MKRTLQIATILLGAALVVTLILQRQTTRRLEQSLSELNRQTHPGSKTESISNDEARKLSVITPVVVKAGANAAEIEALRAEAILLRERVQLTNVFLSSLTETEALWQKLGGEKFEIETEMGAPFAERKYYSKNLWADVGDSSAAAALQTALWAAKSGNVSRFIDIKKWTDVPAERRSHVIERLNSHGLGVIASPANTAVGVKINRQEGDSQKMDFTVIFELGQGRPPQPMRYSLEQVDGAWKLDRVMMDAGESQEYVVPRY
jgi:hypothetical protein